MGSFYQGDEYQFGEYSHGRQCVTNSITAIAYAQMTDIASWNSHDLDFILKEGDCLYLYIRPQQFLGGLSLHFNHLIESRMANCDWPFGTLPFGLFWSNLDTRDLETYPRTYSGHF